MKSTKKEAANKQSDKLDEKQQPSASDEKLDRKRSEESSVGEKDKPATKDGKPEHKVPAVSFFQLFRFHTKFELIINIIGIIPAIAAGAAQPLMSLLFGKLTQDFVNFQITIGSLESSDPNVAAQAAQSLPAVAAGFKASAAMDASYLVYIGVGILVCVYAYMTIWVYTAEMSSKRLRERYLAAILRQDIAFFDDVGAGEVATRIQTDTHLFQQGVSEKICLAVSFISAFFTGFILAYIRSWRLALAMSSILPCIIVTGGVMNKFMGRYKLLSLGYIADGGSFAEEVIGTVRTAQAFGTQKKLADMYDVFVEKSRKLGGLSAAWQGAGMGLFFFIIYSAYALAFTFGATLINEGHADAGTVVNVIMAVLIGSFSLAQLAPEIQAVTEGQGAAGKLYETIARVPTIDSASDAGLKPTKVVGEITLRNVDFTYPSRPNVPIVKNMNLTFEAGKTAALVGASGSGKSTVINLVERFYDPIAGGVFLDGVDLKDINVKWLRSQIGLVSQEPTLFATSVKENVAHGLINTPHENASEETKMELVREACIKSNAHDFISKLPNGYDTLVGERGFLMSGGQKQRIAIARAIVSDPRILLLDEATSALDTQSEGIVQNALDNASAGRTTITIAHRLSTVKDAACIHVMGEGLVLQSGTHTELLKDQDGPYARLVNTQRIREQENEASTVINTETEVVPKSPEAQFRLTRARTGSKATRSVHDAEAGIHTKAHNRSMLYVFGRMILINKEDWGKYTVGLIAAGLTGLVYPGFGIVFAKGISAFSDLDNGSRRFDADRSALWLFIISVGSLFTIGLQSYMLASAAANLAAKLRSLSFRAILRQDIAFFDQDDKSTGGLTSDLSDNAQKVNGLAGVTGGTIIQSFATVVGGIIIGLSFVWKLSLVSFAVLPFVLSTGYIRLKIVVLKDQKNKKSHEKSAQTACEAAGSIRTVASLTREDDCLRIYSQSLEEPLRNSNRTAIWSNLLYGFSQAMSFWVISLIFWYGSTLVASREYTVFQFFVGLMSTTFASIQAGNVFAYVPDISSAKGAASDLVDLFDAVPEIDAESEEGKKISAENVRGRIRFEDVRFTYPTRPGAPILKGLTFTVEPGSYVALVGASGSGKSTCIQLIERFYNTTSGQIYLDDDRISDLHIQDYRKSMSLVSQEPTLYAGTIRFNILLGAIKPVSEVTQEEIDDVCRKANILEFIQSLPDGFDTQVGGKGSQLSGGQKQRIAIARALLRNPKVLLLDEATSALDSNSEKVVQVALDEAAKGRTTISIAHRLSTIQNADRIFFLKEGRICESGTHDQLLRKKGEYYEFVQLQALSTAGKK